MPDPGAKESREASELRDEGVAPDAALGDDYGDDEKDHDTGLAREGLAVPGHRLLHRLYAVHRSQVGGIQRNTLDFRCSSASMIR